MFDPYFTIDDGLPAHFIDDYIIDADYPAEAYL